MSFLSIFGIIMLFSTMVNVKNSIDYNLAIPTNYYSIIINAIVGLLFIIFIACGIIALWNVGFGLYGIKFLH